MDNKLGYRVRLRFRSTKSLGSSELELTTIIDDRPVVIKSGVRDQPLNQAKWFVANARGFPDECTANAFGERLRSIVHLASLCARWGVDMGSDKATGWMAEDFAREMGFIEPHERTAGNIHGLMILPDDDLTKFPIINMKASTATSVDQFLSTITELGLQQDLDGIAAHQAVRLLNFALLQSEPLTRIVLAFSAVEALGQTEKWSRAQAALLEETAASVDTSDHATEAERLEVAEAIRRSHRMGLRQGVVRVLSELGISDRKKEWDRLYSLRSGVIHGTALLTDTELSELANDSIKLAAAIILKRLERLGLVIPSVAETHFVL